ncbi:MAG: Na(+)/H(+) antiporter subunit B [Cyanobacteriota bacterium]|jgi:multicomponent Na+:H+ antiporter subunit B|nr:Na(+)/H(+) antiporter subunit B [Cyanobacteriota bacterium]
MTWLVVVAAVALFASPLAAALPAAKTVAEIVQILADQTQVPNLVSGVILHTRLFDTISEVVVFTLAALGVRHLLAAETAPRQIRALDDPPSVVLCELGATISALIAVELALRGHLTPGGGFAAGVAGGTGVGLLLISGGASRAERLYRRYRADLLEKLAVLGFIVVAFLLLIGVNLPPGATGTLLSGGWIPVLNVLVAIKVTLGSWAMVQLFVRYRGVL